MPFKPPRYSLAGSYTTGKIFAAGEGDPGRQGRLAAREIPNQFPRCFVDHFHVVERKRIHQARVFLLYPVKLDHSLGRPAKFDDAANDKAFPARRSYSFSLQFKCEIHCSSEGEPARRNPAEGDSGSRERASPKIMSTWI